ncbi:MAG: site-specific integrase [Verrucomicrobiales bacterium]|nr:site-specific integrase [Verrucomicrobiales bacterium]
MKARAKRPVRKPESPKSKATVVRVAGIEARIYSNPLRTQGRVYPSFLCKWPDPIHGRQATKRFANLEEAKQHAAEKCRQIANGQASAASISNRDAASLGEARELLGPLQTEIHVAARAYAEAVKELPPGTSLMEAVRYFAARHPSAGARKLVPEVVQEFIQDRTTAGVSDIHLRDLRNRLGRFGEAFQIPITSLTPALVNEHLKRLTNTKSRRPASNRTRANHRALIVSLFNFARMQRYVSRDHADEIAEVPKPKYHAGLVEVYRPEEFARLLAAADEDLRPPLAIAGLAGLRVAEISRLDWRDIKLGERVIIVGDRIAKTASRRVVPICDALAAWLAPAVREFGPVSPAGGEARGVGEALINRWMRMAARAKVTWKRNALRHSFGSYRLAVTADFARVAAEMGNSPAIIHQHYKSLVTEAEGRAWFTVTPSLSGHVAPVLAMAHPSAS